MRASALEHRAAQRCVGAGIKIDLAIQTGKVALGVAAQRKGAVHGMALGMERERLHFTGRWNLYAASAARC